MIPTQAHRMIELTHVDGAPESYAIPIWRIYSAIRDGESTKLTVFTSIDRVDVVEVRVSEPPWEIAQKVNKVLG